MSQMLLFQQSLLLKIAKRLKDEYPNFEVGLKCILMVFTYLLLCSYINENAL